nr:hypothetical protein [uncultured Capnocytophaga sp.]
MNAIRFFEWGFENKKAKAERLKRRQKESDEIYKESLNPPTYIGVIYYKKTDGFWYKETSTDKYEGSVSIGIINPDSRVGYLRNVNADEIEELKLTSWISYVVANCPNLKVIDTTNVYGENGVRINLSNAKSFEKIYLRKWEYDIAIQYQYATRNETQFWLASEEGEYGSDNRGYISGIGNRNVKGVNILTK